MADENVAAAAPKGFDDEGEDFTDSGDKVGEEKKLTDDGGVVKKLVKAGSGWENPDNGDEVSVHYTGTLASDGTKFDSSRDRGQPFTFKLGTGAVIRGWDVGVKTMKRGERAELTLQPEYAYGKQGSPPTIPADATLKFDVELLDWKSVKDIQGDGGIIKKVETEGKDWQHPGELDEVTVRYSFRVQGEAEPFAKTSEDGVQFTVEEGHLMRALPIVVKGMKKGEKAQLVVKPEYTQQEGQGSESGAAAPQGATVEGELELVSWNKVEKLADGRVVKKILKEGASTWDKARQGAKVTVRLTGRLPDGTVFEQHGEGNELKFVTDEEQVAEGLDLAVQEMTKGEQAHVTVQPELAPSSAAVPANTPVTYDVELVELEKAKEKWNMNPEEKVESAEKDKAEGNDAFKAGKWQRAVKKYTRAVEFAEMDDKTPGVSVTDELKSRARDVRKSSRLNLAAAHLKLGQFKEARSACDKVLEADGSNVKALYRRAQAYMGTGDLVEAEMDIRAALVVEPDNRDVRLLQQRYKKEAAASNRKEAALYSTMFARLAKANERSGKRPLAAAAADGAGAENNAASANAAAEAAGPSTSEPAPMETEAQA